jgi:hypothetical protein
MNWPRLIFLAGLGGIAYFLWPRGSTPSAVPPEAAGWDNLLSCSDQVSADEKKTLSLDPDYSATITDSGQGDSDPKPIKGHLVARRSKEKYLQTRYSWRFGDL